MTSLQTWLRELGVGRLLYRTLYRPGETVALAQAHGLRLVCQARYGDWSMRRASLCLPVSAALDQNRFPGTICFLTGAKFIHHTLFCAHSFATHTGIHTPFEFLSDGSLNEDHTRALHRLFPSAIVRHKEELDRAVLAALPPERFPVLHATRGKFVLLKKLTDAMAGQSGYRLFLDSDMLFWRRPQELLDRVHAGAPLYMRDIVDNGYTISAAELGQSLGTPVALGVNSGLIGLDAGRLDWNLLERACAYIENSIGNQRLLEQTLWAVALGKQDAKPLDERAYKVLVAPKDFSPVVADAASLLHYAWYSRLVYSAADWRRYLASLSK